MGNSSIDCTGAAERKMYPHLHCTAEMCCAKSFLEKHLYIADQPKSLLKISFLLPDIILRRD
jgi:hypothetical protein